MADERMGKCAACIAILSAVAVFAYFLLHDSGWAGNIPQPGAGEMKEANPPNRLFPESGGNASAQPLGILADKEAVPKLQKRNQ